MVSDSNDFKVRLTFNRLKTNEYKSIILLCKALPNFKQAIGRREYNELELNKTEFNEYYHKFFFVCNQVNKYKSTKLFCNDERINIKDIQSIYSNFRKTLVNSEESHSNKKHTIKKSRSISKIKLLNKKDDKKIYEEKIGTSQSTFEELIKEIENEDENVKINIEKEERLIPDVTFDDIGGIDDVLQEIRETIELPLKVPQIFSHLSIKPHKGVLLYGPPGCGKTMIAKAISNEIKAHFIPVKASELMSMWHGLSEENLRKIFEEARDKQPSIIYFDEIDSIARVRSDDERGRYDHRFLTQLLALMDGIEDYGKICIIGSTNMMEVIDKALLRPGRFDLKILIKKPDKKGCTQIFTKVTKDMPIDDKFDKEKFSNLLVGLSGAEISFIGREAAYNCMRRNLNVKELLNNNKEIEDYLKLIVNEDDFYNALNKVKIQYK